MQIYGIITWVIAKRKFGDVRAHVSKFVWHTYFLSQERADL
ncbi:hypothetical protein ABIE33_006949 [Ensifer sp. 4252]